MQLADMILRHRNVLEGLEHRVHCSGVARHFFLIPAFEFLNLEPRQQNGNLLIRELASLNAGIEKYLKLLDEVIKTVDSRGTKIWERWSKHLNLPDSSVWVVNAADGTDDALLPLRRGQ